jgi:hypothetical protein
MADNRETNNNTLIGLSLFFGVGLMALFFADMLDSKAGERAAAFGAVIGGLIGAGAAVMAVRLTIKSQRDEEREQVRSAVRIEVITYTKYVIDSLKICERIATQGMQMPCQDAGYMARNLSEPIIYPAVADRIGLLHHPQATIFFYMRVFQAKETLNTISLRAETPSINPLLVVPEFVTPDNAAAIADCLIDALKKARPIIIDDDTSRSTFDKMIRGIALRDINAALESAKATFPNAESFHEPPL